MFTDIKLEIVNLLDSRQLKEIEDFLAQYDLTFEDKLEYTVAARLGEKLVGTGSFKGEVLRNIAIDEQFQGLGLTATIVTALIQEQARRGKLHYFVFTKPGKAHLFASLGFKEIARAEPYAVLLETGLGSIDSYCKETEDLVSHLPEPRAAVVVNCNPFTKGHQALIENAAAENAAVIVFLVSEDRSLFPFADRLRLVKAGLAHLPNVAVVPTGKYIISTATFPAYFTRDAAAVAAQTRLDITLFATKIARHLQITTRYVGQEPYCQVTDAYNLAMLDILPVHGIRVKIMERIQANGEVISASRVRELIKRDDWAAIRRLVPETTYNYLISDTVKPIVHKIRSADSRH